MKKVVMINLDFILKYLLVRPDKFNITIIKYYLNYCYAKFRLYFKISFSKTR
jgi:hypothetical protein